MKRLAILTLTVLFAAFFATAQNYSRLLMLKKSRMNGEDVRAVQEALNNLGFTEVGEADGWFGPKTEKAVKEFQKLTGFSTNGVVNKDIYDLLVKNKGGNVIKSYMKNLKTVNEIKRMELSRESYDYSGHSTEGGEICVYKDGTKSLYANMSIAGETGMFEATLYKVSGQAGILVCETTQYNSHMNANPEKATVEYKIYYCFSGVYFNIANGQATDCEDDIIDCLDQMASRM